MNLDLILAGAAGGVVGATIVLAARTVTAAVSTWVAKKPSRIEPTTPSVTLPIEPEVVTAHARLRERQLAEFADHLAGDDLVLRERLRRFEGGLS